MATTEKQQTKSGAEALAILHAIYTLADYPVLAALAADRTQATRLDGRACLHLYMAGLGNIDWLTVSPPEKQLMRRLGLFSICPACGAQSLVRDTRDHTMTSPDGQAVTVRNLTGDYCNACGEVILDAAEGKRTMTAIRACKP